MYSSEKNPGINWKDIIVKAIFFVIFILLLIWLFPKVPNMTAFYSNVFRENISYMQDAAKSYYTNERLPKNVGDVAEMTLQDMIDKNLIIPFVDKDGKTCDTHASYVQVTKEEDEYALKINLVCDTESSYIIEPMGCYDYCEGDNCKTPETAATALEYQFKQAYTTNKTTYSCPSGYTRNGLNCYKSSTSKIDATANYISKDIVSNALINSTGSYTQYTNPIVSADSEFTCPSGYTRSGSTCYKTTSATVEGGSTTYTCPSGYTRSGSTCYKTSTVSATATGGSTTYSCPSGYTRSGSTCSKTTTTSVAATKIYEGMKNSSVCQSYLGSKCVQYKQVAVYTYACPSGYSKSGSNCTKSTTSTVAATASTSSTTYTCPSGYTRSGSTCTKTDTVSATATGGSSSYTCPSGYTLNGSTCYKYTEGSYDYDYTYTCPTGYIRSGSGANTTCYRTITGTSNYYCANSTHTLVGTKCYGTEKTFSGYTCPSGYSLDGKVCFKQDAATVKATSSTKKVTGYNYKWSKSETLEGWERTGKTRTVEA